MRIIGLTGGIASGKSTAARILENLGAHVVDMDILAHRVMESGEPAWTDIVKHFGEGILNPDQSIDRAALGAIVFAQPEELQALNRFTHPRVFDRLRSDLHKLRHKGEQQVVVIEAALLYETGMDEFCDEIWVVWTDEATQLRRLRERNGFSREESQRRIDAQMPLEEKAGRADRVIDNRGGPEHLRQLTEEAYQAALLRI